MIAVGLLSACTAGAGDGDVAEIVEDEPGRVELTPVDESDDVSTGSSSQLGAVIVANSPGSVSVNGTQRMMTAILGSGVPYLGGPDIAATVLFHSPSGGDPIRVEADWVTTDVSPLGLYVSLIDFAEDGVWGVAVELDGEVTDTALYEVVQASATPQPGALAPLSITPISADVDDLAEITTDPEPDPSFYELSIGDAVANGRPSIVVFSTPAFCETALCGPTTDIVKAAVASRGDVDVVHVEPFDIAQAQQGVKVPIEALAEWGIVTEPWVFVVDAEGKVVRSFEGILGQEELILALEEV